MPAELPSTYPPVGVLLAAAIGAVALVVPWVALAGTALDPVARVVVDNSVVLAGCACLSAIARGPWQSGNADLRRPDHVEVWQPATPASPGGPTGTPVARRELPDHDERRAAVPLVRL